MQANKYPSNFEGWYLLEKMKEQEQLSKFPIEEVDNFEIEFDKEPVDYMESMPLTFVEPPQKSSETTASSSSDND